MVDEDAGGAEDGEEEKGKGEGEGDEGESHRERLLWRRRAEAERRAMRRMVVI